MSRRRRSSTNRSKAKFVLVSNLAGNNHAQLVFDARGHNSARLRTKTLKVHGHSQAKSERSIDVLINSKLSFSNNNRRAPLSPLGNRMAVSTTIQVPPRFCLSTRSQIQPVRLIQISIRQSLLPKFILIFSAQVPRSIQTQNQLSLSSKTSPSLPEFQF